MHATREIKKKTKNGVIEVIEVPPVKVGNFIPIQGQIMMKAQMRRHDKSKSRSKAKRSWSKG
jgi:hypothetical protein